MSLAEFMMINSTKKEIDLLREFKIFLSEIIIIISNSQATTYDDLQIKTNLFEEAIYNSLMKIKFYLQILEVKDKNQTNKCEYENSLMTLSFIKLFEIEHLLSQISKIINNDLDAQLSTIMDTSKIYNKDDPTEALKFINKYEIITNELKINRHKQAILMYNNLINNILLQIICVNEIIKNINITFYDHFN